MASSFLTLNVSTYVIVFMIIVGCNVITGHITLIISVIGAVPSISVVGMVIRTILSTAKMDTASSNIIAHRSVEESTAFSRIAHNEPP